MVLIIAVSTEVSYGRRLSKDDRGEKREDKKEARKQRRENRGNLQGELQLSGSFALYPLVTRWAKEFEKIYPNVKIDISAGGAGKGVTDALSGVVDIGMISRDINKAEVKSGAMTISVAKDAVVATVNSKNPNILEILGKGLSWNKIKRVWLSGATLTWGELLGTESSETVHLFTRSDACGAAEMWGKIIDTEPEDIQGTAVYGDPGIASVVQRDKLALGYNSISYAYNLRTDKPHRGLIVVPIDANEDGLVDLGEDHFGSLSELIKAVQEDKYPARELYFVCKGVPRNEAAIAFIEFVLTQGQQSIDNSGYVALDDNEIETQLSKLEQ